MKKYLLLLFCNVFCSFTVMAQYSFPPIIDPVNVASGTATTIHINDEANSAGVPTGIYYTFSVSADWEAGEGGPWSTEANLTVVTASGSVLVDPATSGSFNTEDNTTLIFESVFSSTYDPSVDGLLDLQINQSYAESDFNLSNIVVTLIPCLSPVATVSIVDDCANNQFTIDVDITSLGSATSVTLSNNVGVTATSGITTTGIKSVGPFPKGNTVVLTLQHDQNSACNLSLGNSIDNCIPINDECSEAIAINCGDTVSGSTVSATDSGNNPAHDVWYSYSGDAGDITASLCGSDYDTNIVIYNACGENKLAENEDFCGENGVRSLVTFTADGTSTYYIMIEGYGSYKGVYELELSCQDSSSHPVNDACVNAIDLTLGVKRNGTTIGATEAIEDEHPSCDLFGTIADVWYTVIVPISGKLDFETTITGASSQANLAVYSDFGGLQASQIGCSDEHGGESLSLTGLAPGATLYVRVWSNGVSARNSQFTQGMFDILVTDPWATNSDSKISVLYFPNPVKETLLILSNKEIQNISIYNILGQEVYLNSPNVKTEKLNMDKFQSGTYFVKVTILDVTKTIRVIKN